MPEVYSWTEDAKCEGEPVNLFYPPRDKSLYKTIADQSKAICRGKDGRPECIVRWECALDAIKRDEPHGIWGGLSHRERNAAVRKWRKTRDQGRHKKSLEDYVMDGMK